MPSVATSSCASTRSSDARKPTLACSPNRRVRSGCANAGWDRAVDETRLILIRHGETEWNITGRIQGYRADSALTATGREQVRALAVRLAREGIDALYSSDAGRTRETADPIAAATRWRRSATIRSPTRASIISVSPARAGCSMPGATSRIYPRNAWTSCKSQAGLDTAFALANSKPYG